MRKFRPYHYGGMVDSPHGDYVLFADAEAAIEQARRDEREKCVAELSALAMKESDELAAKVQELQKKLAEQNAVLNSSEATMQLNKQMVKYTEEKARRSNNLLQLYGFLNVVVLGLLVYVYRAAGDE